MLRLEKDTARKELMSANMKKRGLEADLDVSNNL
jgi:hypothetical protein